MPGSLGTQPAVGALQRGRPCGRDWLRASRVQMPMTTSPPSMLVVPPSYLWHIMLVTVPVAVGAAAVATWVVLWELPQMRHGVVTLRYVQTATWRKVKLHRALV